jgi:hypothetical protein
MAASTPPMPKPVSTRHNDRSMTPRDVVAMNIPAVITTRQPRIVGRRPILSATPPRNTEPIAMPMSSIDSTIPRAPRSMCHSEAIPGEANAMESTSNPSNAFSPMVIATTMTCRTLIGQADIVARGSMAVFTLMPPGNP